MVEGQLKALMPVAPSSVPVATVPDGAVAAVDPPMPEAASPAARLDAAPAPLEIVLPDGVMVRVSAAVEEVALRRVLAALGRR